MGAQLLSNSYRRLLNWLDELTARLGKRPQLIAIHELGRRGEDLAYWFLREQGYIILARNYRQPHRRGEIDLIALDRDELVFIEVKSRTAHGEFPAEQAVNRDKRKHLIALARTYARRRGREHFRFDVVAIYAPDAPRPEVILHKNAFQASGPRNAV